MCRDADYIKVDRIRKNARFFAEGLEITINLSKPEKDPRDIANALDAFTAAANTSFNGEYIFSGVKTDSRPLDDYTSASSTAKAAYASAAW